MGNVDTTVDDEEFLNFFKKLFRTIKSGMIIYDSNTGKSKGYGFINLTSYIEYLKLIKSNKPYFLHQKILIIK